MAENTEIKLTPKQELFVQEYLIDFNATDAARRAGYSEKTATSIGAENLTKPHIKELIDKAKQNRAEKTEVTKDYLISNLVHVIETSKDNPRGYTNLIKASEVLNKMMGYNEVKRVDITTGGERINWIEERTYAALPPNNINEVK